MKESRIDSKLNPRAIILTAMSERDRLIGGDVDITSGSIKR